MSLRDLSANATPGPWRWFGQRASGMFLGTPYGGRRMVMDFVRQGMRGAQPRFQVYKDRDGEPWAWNGLMTPASDLAVLEVSYREDIRDIDHPDARLIALAPEMAGLLSDMADALDMAEGAMRFEEDQEWFDAELRPLLARFRALEERA